MFSKVQPRVNPHNNVKPHNLKNTLREAFNNLFCILTMEDVLNMPVFEGITNTPIKQQFIQIIHGQRYTPQEAKSIFTIKFTAELMHIIESNGLKPHDIKAIFGLAHELGHLGFKKQPQHFLQKFFLAG